MIIPVTKIISSLSRKLNLGAGSTWPGHIALQINKNFISDILNKNPHLKVILVAGTNGKTTTSKLLRFILEKKGLKVFQNESGANLLNGVASSLIAKSNSNGQLSYDAVIFEVDENVLPIVLQHLTPTAIILLDLFRDQLDRYGEVNTIAKKWIEAFKKLSLSSNQDSGVAESKSAPQNDNQTVLIANGDDPQISFIGQNSQQQSFFFGVDERFMQKKEIPHDVDSIYCPVCKYKLKYKKIAYSHLGEYFCSNCKFKKPTTETYSKLDKLSHLSGIYNLYNTNGALLTAEKIFNIKRDELFKDILDFKPAFGRQEEILYKGKKIKVLLSKNPTGFNQSIETILQKKKDKLNVLLVLNDRIPDGRDVSWIWDVDFEELVKKSTSLTISGDRVWDMTLRVKYCLNTQSIHTNHKSFENLNDAINFAIEQTPVDETLYILPTYSAMLDVRKILTGKKIL